MPLERNSRRSPQRPARRPTAIHIGAVGMLEQRLLVQPHDDAEDVPLGTGSLSSGSGSPPSVSARPLIERVVDQRQDDGLRAILFRGDLDPHRDRVEVPPPVVVVLHEELLVLRWLPTRSRCSHGDFQAGDQLPAVAVMRADAGRAVVGKRVGPAVRTDQQPLPPAAPARPKDGGKAAGLDQLVQRLGLFAVLGPVEHGRVTDHAEVVVADQAAALGELLLRSDDAANEGVGEIDEAVFAARRRAA